MSEQPTYKTEAFAVGTTAMALLVTKCSNSHKIEPSKRPEPYLNVLTSAGSTMVIGYKAITDLKSACDFAIKTDYPDDELRVVKLTRDGSTLYARLSHFAFDLNGLIEPSEEDEPYTFELVTMTRKEFNGLGDFNGF